MMAAGAGVFAYGLWRAGRRVARAPAAIIPDPGT